VMSDPCFVFNMIYFCIRSINMLAATAAQVMISANISSFIASLITNDIHAWFQ
jgi:hypothetical protein